MILWRNIEIFTFYHFDFDPRFPPFLLYSRWKSGVTFVRRCFRDVILGTFRLLTMKALGSEKQLHMKTIQNILMTVLAGCQVSDCCPLGYLFENVPFAIETRDVILSKQ